MCGKVGLEVRIKSDIVFFLRKGRKDQRGKDQSPHGPVSVMATFEVQTALGVLFKGQFDETKTTLVKNKW